MHQVSSITRLMFRGTFRSIELDVHFRSTSRTRSLRSIDINTSTSSCTHLSQKSSSIALSQQTSVLPAASVVIRSYGLSPPAAPTVITASQFVVVKLSGQHLQHQVRNYIKEDLCKTCSHLQRRWLLHQYNVHQHQQHQRQQ